MDKMHILTATSGDTGSAMVQAFYKKTTNAEIKKWRILIFFLILIELKANIYIF